MEIKTDTIAAIATAPGDSGIGIVRVSGENAITIVDSIFQNAKGNHVIKHAKSHTIHYGFIVLNNKSFDISDKNNVIDEVLVSIFRAPKSYTMEDTVEINCHGGSLIVKKVLEAVLQAGARLAEPGEFTKRAFFNGRIDLSEAEAVMDLIHSKNELARKSSIGQLRGDLSQKITGLREKLIYEIAFIESALDDPEHISLEGYPETLEKKLTEIISEIQILLATAENGRMVKEGISTVIVGKPNAGKSSLLNMILGQDRAIVTDIAGTTRDVLEESFRFRDIHLNIIDTAGIRDTQDIVEKIGVDRAKQYAKDADLILYVVDSSVELDENDREILSFIQGKKVIFLLNKSDLEAKVTEEDLIEQYFYVSGEHDQLKNHEDIGDNVNIKNHEDIGDHANIKNHVGICDHENIKNHEDICDHENIESENLTINDKNVIKNTRKDQICVIYTSAIQGKGLNELENAIEELLFSGAIHNNDEIMITNMRHKEALNHALESLKLVKKSIEDDMPEDFYTIDLMEAYASLGNILGEEVGDDLVEEIFSKFCMGK